ncbi:uncharacterized protein LOC130853148 isoform X2 [Hippopotamus amphibius kiboko]|uniref:uncharacterized protein LOC130853148 isoform X2 n=1 Tax=Hippopotamus amphibius kiboko TaxID=575201 RepID=UPI0025950FBB|nr:uncharacterized protein LOC130853148 isoform X2 [Hippopotamus amphibius kiboko]
MGLSAELVPVDAGGRALPWRPRAASSARTQALSSCPPLQPWLLAQRPARGGCSVTGKSDITNECRECGPSEQSAMDRQPGLLYPGLHRWQSYLPVMKSESSQIKFDMSMGESRPGELDLPQTWEQVLCLPPQPAAQDLSVKRQQALPPWSKICGCKPKERSTVQSALSPRVWWSLKCWANLSVSAGTFLWRRYLLPGSQHTRAHGPDQRQRLRKSCRGVPASTVLPDRWLPPEETPGAPPTRRVGVTKRLSLGRSCSHNTWLGCLDYFHRSQRAQRLCCPEQDTCWKVLQEVNPTFCFEGLSLEIPRRRRHGQTGRSGEHGRLWQHSGARPTTGNSRCSR